MANDYHWRSTKAKKQLRDRFGRWISLGANVSFRAEGKEQSGVVTSVVDGKAYVDQKNRDGSTTQQIIEPGDIRVISSKATLPQDGSKIFDKDNDFYAVMDSPEYREAMNKYGEALIEREDGYSLSAKFENETQGKAEAPDPMKLKDPKKNNPVLYQLFAPTGRSLGTYSRGAEGDFNAMVSTHKGSPSPVAASIATVGEEKPYRVPDAVKKSISESLPVVASGLSDDEVAIASRLANDDTVSYSDVEWIHNYFSENTLSENLHGGFKGRKWAEKIVASGSDEPDSDDIDLADPKFNFDDDVYAYFAIGDTPGSTFVNQLIATETETGDVLSWGPTGFTPVPDQKMEDVEAPQIIPVDEITALSIAKWLSDGKGEFDVLDADPEERNLYTLAESEIDFEELDRAFSIIASANQYTPMERSQNAKAQRRGAGGRFGAQPDEPEEVQEAAGPAVKKAVLPVELPLVENPAARIAEWISTAAEAPVVAAGEADPGYDETDQAVEDAATGPSDEVMYFAIVDEVDKTAVMDAVAITKEGGQPAAYIRSGGSWKSDPDMVTVLSGNAPPPVVELDDPNTVKTVLSQIDSHDAEEAPAEPVAASGYALPDGSHVIIDENDLQAVVASVSHNPDLLVKAHVRKRAHALNRMDLVPSEWREFTLAEIGELSASQSVYGEFGEIIVAAGVPGIADTPSDWKNVMKLQNYWTRGKGALKIRWGTPGDLTRAHRHLSKYVGPQRAWGLAQKYHKSLFGVYNHTHDVATGQYKPRRRKK